MTRTNWPLSGRRQPAPRARLGTRRMSPLKVIRAKCCDCSYFQLNEIRLCEAANRVLVVVPVWSAPLAGRGAKTAAY